MRFKRRLNTGDSRDRPVVPGVLEILVGYGENDNPQDKHKDAALGYIDMFTGLGPPIGAQTVSTARVNPANYQFVASILPPFCKLWWKLINSNASISAAMECLNQGYLAFGITNQAGGGMTNSDMWIGRVTGGTMTVSDYWSANQGTPTLDTVQSLTATSGSRVGGNTTMFFTRLLNTGDSKDYVIKPGLTECIVAMHATSDLLIYHDRNRATVFIDFFSGTAPTAPAPAAIDTTWNPAAYPNRFDAVPGVYEIYWMVDGAAKAINFAVRVQGATWAGLGPSKTSAGAMSGSDPMVAYFDAAGNPVIEDQWSVSISSPVADTNKGGKASFTAMSGSLNATGLTVKWTRSFDTLDASTDNAISLSRPVTLVLAWGTGSLPSYHGPNRAAVTIDLSTGAGSVTGGGNDPLKVAHGALMAIAFGLCMSVGTVFALVVPKNKVWWFPAHWILQVVAVGLMFIAFFIMVAWYQQSGSAHFRTNSLTMGAHAVIGIIIIVAVAWQAILGLVADRVWQREYKRTSQFPQTKAFPDKTHWWIGRAILVFACINIYLGIAEMGWTWPFYVGWTVFCVLLLLLFVVACVFYFKNSSLSGHHAPSKPNPTFRSE